MKVADLLNAVKIATGIKSDGELARMLGVSKQAMSSYYNGHRAPDDFACLQIAEATGTPLDTVIATVKAATETDEKRREAWENYMKRLGGLAASVMAGIIFAVTFIVTPTPANAAVTPSESLNAQGIQIMREFQEAIEAALRKLKMLLLRVYWPDSLNNGKTA